MKKHLYKIISCIFATAFFMVQGSAFAQGIVNEAITIDSLDSQSVTINKTKFINIDNTDYQIDEPLTVSFENSDEGRKALSESIPEPFLSAIMSIWGRFPIVALSTKSTISLADRLSKLEAISKSEALTINEVVSINFLDNKYAAFLKTKYTTIDDISYQLGHPWAVSYENSARGRELFVKNIPDPFYSAVMSVWGDTPTVILPVEIEDPNLK